MENTDTNQSIITEENNVDSEALEKHCMFLWEKLNETVNVIENRNFNTLSLSSLFAGIAFIVSSMTKAENLFSYICIIIPVIALIVFFYNAFNNKIAAIIKGYLCGLEELLNSSIKKNVYTWHLNFRNMYRIPYFLTNNLSGIMFFCATAVIVVYSYIKMFQLAIGSETHKVVFIILIILYILFFLFFAIIFAVDTFTNDKATETAHAYFIKNYNITGFSTDHDQAEILKAIFNSHKKL